MCRRRVVERARDGNPNIFMTLTWNSNRAESPAEAARVMKHAWVVLRRRIERHYGINKIPFLVVFEKTKKGYPHMHLLIRSRYIDQDWLSDQMDDLIDAPIVDIRKIKDRKMAFYYVTKYLGKDLAAFEGCKRWWRSHNYETEKEPEYRPFLFGDCLRIEPVDYYTMASRYRVGGYEVIDEGRDWLTYRRRISGPPTLRVWNNPLPSVADDIVYDDIEGV